MSDTVLDSLEGLPEELHRLFEETEDGGYKVKPFETEDEITGLKTALEKEREARRKFEKTLKEKEGAPQVDLDEYRRLKEEAAKREEQQALAKGEYEKLLAKRDEKHAAALAEAKREAEEVRKKFEAVTAGRQLREAIVEAGVKPELQEAAELLLKHRGFEVSYNDAGDPVGVFRDEYKQARPATEFVKEWAASKEAESFLPPDVKTGGGASGRSGAGGAGRKAFKDMSEREKMDLADELPPEEYAALVMESYGG